MTPLAGSPLGGAPLAFAGIWTMSVNETLTCSVITTAALGGLAEVHDRMPLILPRVAGAAGRRRGWTATAAVATRRVCCSR